MSEPTVVARIQGRVGRITLNRPTALNALDLPMIQAIAAALARWAGNSAVHAVVLDAAGGRAFCAGGDVQTIRALSLAGDHQAVERFFVEEYALNLTIARYPKPYISLIDGICMGGGIGLSVHGGIRVATPRAQFAMPETIVGLFPDVGATFILPRLRGRYGMYLALTGARVGGREAAWLGLATHLALPDRFATLADELAEDGIAALAAAAIAPDPGELAGLEETVACFGHDSVLGIMAALDRLDTMPSRAALAMLRAASPSSLLWSFEIVRRGARHTLEQCQQAELALTRVATRHPDFIEGVRAMVVDKDRTPAWSPARVEDVDPAFIQGLFA